LVVGDLDDPYIPVPDDLLVNLNEARPMIERFLEKLNAIYQNTNITASALGPAMQAAFKLVQSIGGKIVVIQASMPTLGAGGLKMREDPKALGTSNESALLQPAVSFYKSFSIDCSRAQVSVDLFLFANQYLDLSSLCTFH
jgi:protein transport protein SEC24